MGRAAVEALAGLDRNTRWQLLAPLLDDAVRGVRIAVAVALADVPMESLDEAGRRQLQQAFGEYLAAERLNADRVEHWVNVAGFHMRRGELDAAEASYRAALQRNPRYSPAYVNQADMYRALGREEDAEKVLRSGIAVLPDDGSLHQALGLLLIRTGRVDEALLELRTAYELDRQNPFFGYVYGVALDSTGAAGRAVNVWRDVLAQHPNDRDTLQALAVGLYRQGEHGQARVIAERLSLVLPGNPPVVQLMAAIKAAAGGATQ